MSLMGSIQAIAYTFCVEKDLSAWRLGHGIRLLTVVYVVSTFLSHVVQYLMGYSYLSFFMTRCCALVLAGRVCIWNIDYTDIMDDKEERAIVRIDLQSGDAGCCGHCQLFPSQREAPSWKVIQFHLDVKNCIFELSD